MKCAKPSCFSQMLPGEMYCHAHLVEHERQVAYGRERLLRAMENRERTLLELQRIEEGYR